MSDFSGLNAGDRIAIYCSEYSKQWYSIKRVDAIAKGGIIKIGSYSFKPDGRQHKGDSMSLHMELREITPEVEQAIRAQIARRKIDAIKASELGDEQAIALYEAYQQIVGGE